MGGLKVAIKAVAFFLWCALLIPLQYLSLKISPRHAALAIPILWHWGMCKVFGLKVVIEGTPVRNRQTIFVSNHVSYLDIPVLGSVLKASFVAKKDVAGWPVFGTLARLQQTAFISRSRSDAQREKNALSNMLADGKSLILFPEGTSTDGRDVAPFKSSLFSMALEDNGRPMLIQPVTLRLEAVNGRLLGDQSVRDLYAWYGEMTMPPHLKSFTASKGAIIRLIFHPPINPAAYADRKILADDCWNAVRSSIQQQKLAAGLAA